MIKGKVLKFGYGDIAVGALGLSMEFTPFKPPVEVGSRCNELFRNGDIKPVGEKVLINLATFEDFRELRNKLKNTHIKKDSRIFEFKGYTFDFSNYNEKSIEVCETVLNYICATFIRNVAC